MGSPPHPDARPWPDDHRPTAFQAAVVAAVEALRPGELVTFAEIADQVGRPGAGQAVANVLRGAPDLPWWRVLPGDGRLYRGHGPSAPPGRRAVALARARTPGAAHPLGVLAGVEGGRWRP